MPPGDNQSPELRQIGVRRGTRTCVSPNGRNRRSVWTIGTQGYKEAHFATYPFALVEPYILVGSSEKGCCSECGAPWKRIVKKKRKATRPGRDNVNDETGMANRDPKRHVTERRTTSWQAGCSCKAGEPVPCTVLDPFVGSGTTVLVARRLGRRGIGIELNRDYCRMAERRIIADAPLLNTKVPQ